jgi:hypothetical protein
MDPLPAQDAPTKELDQYFQRYFKLTQEAALKARELAEYLEKKIDTAEARENWIKSIPNQARGFFKWRKGVSDTLKAKVMPKNKHTVDVIHILLKSVAIKRNAIGEVLKAGHFYDLANAEIKKPFFLKGFAQFYLAHHVDDYAKFESKVRDQYKVAVGDEKNGIDLLYQYLSEKKQAQDEKIPEQDYKEFKKFWDNLAKSLK